MDRITFEIPGEPVGKARPKVTKRGTYTPKKTKEYEELVRWSFVAKRGQFQPLTGPVSATIEAVFAIPKSVTKKNRDAMQKGQILPLKKPDADNIAKAVLDSLNDGFGYHDDAQVVSLNVRKRYCAEGELPHVTVHLEPYKPEEEE